MSAFAADGKIMFTDPQTKTGETFEVTGVYKSQQVISVKLRLP
jgi:hypothetical protein